MKDEHDVEAGWEDEKDEPHLVDGRGERQTQGVTGDWQACFEARSAEREVGFDFVSVVARECGRQTLHMAR